MAPKLAVKKEGKAKPKDPKSAIDELKDQIKQLQNSHESLERLDDDESTAAMQKMVEGQSAKALKLCNQLAFQCDRMDQLEKNKMKFNDSQKQSALMLRHTLDTGNKPDIEEALAKFNTAFGINTTDFVDRLQKPIEEQEGIDVYWPEGVEGELTGLPTL